MFFVTVFNIFDKTKTIILNTKNMKKLILSVVFLNAICISGQLTAKYQIDSIIVQMLKEDEILISNEERNCKNDCLWSKEKHKKKILEKDERLKKILLNKFSCPTFSQNKKIDVKYIFPNQSIRNIGSYIIRNGDFSVMNTKLTPQLPILLNGRQLSIVNPQQNNSNYILNYTTANLFKGQSKTELKAEFLSYFNTKQDLSLNMEDSKRSTLTLGAGVFKNELAELFQRTVENRINPREFFTLYDIWVKYSINSIQHNYEVIKSFEGICSFKGKGVKSNSQIQYDAQFNAGYNQFQFLSLSNSSIVNWGKTSSIDSQAETYDIFMFSKPELMKIPAPNEIMKNWMRLRHITDDVIQDFETIPHNRPLEVKVKFGPIAHHDFISNIKLDEKFTLDNMDVLI